MSCMAQKWVLPRTVSVEPAPRWLGQQVLRPQWGLSFPLILLPCHSPSHLTPMVFFLCISLPPDRVTASFCNVLGKARALYEKADRAFLLHSRKPEQGSARQWEGLAHLPPSLPFPVPQGTLSRKH